MSLLQQQYKQFTEDFEDNLARLIESCKKYHSGMIKDNKDWWDNLSDDDRDGLIMDHLLNYADEGYFDEQDLHWWSGRLALAKELDNQ